MREANNIDNTDKNHDTDKDKAKVRRRKWYKRFNLFADKLDAMVPIPANREKLLRSIHSMIYYTTLGTQRGAYEAVRLIISERGWDRDTQEDNQRTG